MSALISRTIRYSCQCTKTSLVDLDEFWEARQKGRIRTDPIFNRLGQYVDTYYFDFQKCSSCKGK